MIINIGFDCLWKHVFINMTIHYFFEVWFGQPSKHFQTPFPCLHLGVALKIPAEENKT